MADFLIRFSTFFAPDVAAEPEGNNENVTV
jgi:hypothetical protein